MNEIVLTGSTHSYRYCVSLRVLRIRLRALHVLTGTEDKIDNY